MNGALNFGTDSCLCRIQLLFVLCVGKLMVAQKQFKSVYVEILHPAIYSYRSYLICDAFQYFYRVVRINFVKKAAFLLRILLNFFIFAQNLIFAQYFFCSNLNLLIFFFV